MWQNFNYSLQTLKLCLFLRKRNVPTISRSTNIKYLAKEEWNIYKMVFDLKIFFFFFLIISANWFLLMFMNSVYESVLCAVLRYARNIMKTKRCGIYFSFSFQRWRADRKEEGGRGESRLTRKIGAMKFRQIQIGKREGWRNTLARFECFGIWFDLSLGIRRNL